jgi:hypothetical protein
MVKYIIALGIVMGLWFIIKYVSSRPLRNLKGKIIATVSPKFSTEEIISSAAEQGYKLGLERAAQYCETRATEQEVHHIPRLELVQAANNIRKLPYA